MFNDKQQAAVSCELWAASGPSWNTVGNSRRCLSCECDNKSEDSRHVPSSPPEDKDEAGTESESVAVAVAGSLSDKWTVPDRRRARRCHLNNGQVYICIYFY